MRWELGRLVATSGASIGQSFSTHATYISAKQSPMHQLKHVHTFVKCRPVCADVHFWHSWNHSFIQSFIGFCVRHMRRHSHPRMTTSPSKLTSMTTFHFAISKYPPVASTTHNTSTVTTGSVRDKTSAYLAHTSNCSKTQGRWSKACRGPHLRQIKLSAPHRYRGQRSPL